LMALSRYPGWYRQPDKWRAARDRLLQEMRRNGTIDDATLLEATARSVEWRAPTPVELDEDWRGELRRRVLHAGARPRVRPRQAVGLTTRGCRSRTSPLPERNRPRS
jgi:hypothetical protein